MMRNKFYQLFQYFLVIGLLVFVNACAPDFLSTSEHETSTSETSTPETSTDLDSETDEDSPLSDACQEALDSLSLKSIFDTDGDKLPDVCVNSNLVHWTSPKSSDTPNFSGVGRYGGCTATLIETQASDPLAPAYILTNGHCVGRSYSLISGSDIFFDVDPRDLSDSDVSTYKTMSFFYYLGQRSEDYLIVEDKRVSFASMKDTDVAIVELNTTLAELKRLGVDAYSIANEPAAQESQLTNVGVPLSYMDSENVGLRRSECKHGETVSILEGVYSFANSFRHNCSIVGGNSGSPLFNSQNLRIVGVVNTAVNDGTDHQADCSLSKPCELNGDHINVFPEVNYGQYVDYVSECFTQEGYFNKDLADCGINEKFSL